MIHYLSSFEKSIDIFGYLFSNIHIRRWDSEKTNKQDIYVPIEFNSKERMFYLINNKMKNDNIKIDSVFPRMGYTMTGFQYDGQRMLNRSIQIKNNYGENYIEVEDNRIPYILTFDLNIASTHKSDLFQIIEQILPWFRPSITIKANLNPYIGDDKTDVHVVLKTNSYTDQNNETPFSEKPDGLYIETLTFDMKTWLYSLNNEGNDGSYPDNQTIGNTIKEIELGATNWRDSRPVTDDSLYNIHYPEHLD